MGAILLGSADGTLPSPGTSNNIKIPEEIPSDPIVLVDTVKLNEPEEPSE